MAPSGVIINPYHQHFDIAALSEEQREAVKQHTLTEFPAWANVVLGILTLGIFSAINHGLKHGKLPKIKADDPSAGKAVGFWFIPYFSLYWIFPMFVGLADRLNFQYKLRGARPPISRDLVIWTNALYVAGALIIITYPVAFVMFMICAAKFQTATNRLARGEVGTETGYVAGAIAQPVQPAPAQPQPAQPFGAPPPPPPPRA